jgi:small GTP-binding protein
MNSVNVNQESTKVIIVGLDNCGKTSILISLKQDSNLLSYITLNPTRGTNIEEITGEERRIRVWDLGGQQQYRTKHLKKFNEYIIGVKTLIFVIDIQDTTRYKLALNYFKDIIDLLDENKKFINISIYLHKYDPNLKKQKEFQNIDKLITGELIKPIEQMISSDFKYNIFKTSIYTIFEKTLVK